ncbi:uncharacterized protein A1O5_01833 [Cladophialophora psammophila CBS 110553]|uniref:Uncharacterized protein n=1 Tax=Cladophialophora psammophila CBS 110553 TaxID=1182543 RepID=W9X3R9_9EURO|nr:uncharacterized protein A1O5_01833 [Cladophialophora psammophila CBS 110553]EXJ75137.1 hypothetical protein A1O5_01833 [Cladophialophora psammophila CBS 110553]
MTVRPPTSQSSDEEHIEMEDNGISRNSSRQRFLRPRAQAARRRLAGLASHTLGLILLLCVVFLWTMSNFLGSSIFADNTYAKPFFLTYLNTSTFILAMIPTLLRTAYKRHRDRGDLYDTIRARVLRAVGRKGYRQLSNIDSAQDPEEEGQNSECETFIQKPSRNHSTAGTHHHGHHNVEEEGKHLGIIPTARLAFAFCILWFSANYFAMACLKYTTVASTTILTSTSSFWTLFIGALTGTEKFTWRKLCGVLASFAGIILISTVDFSAKTDGGVSGSSPQLRGEGGSISKRVDTFPDKPPSELALGDAFALLSAIIYGVYTITLKKTTIKALPRSLNMPLFFGLVGACNLVLLFPLFPILHYTGLEPFSFPPSRRIWTILLINSCASFCSDLCWAYAMVLTSPLLVTVGLSLTIPLSLVGEMVLQGHYEGWVYWVGAAIVVGSFLFIDQEEKKEEVFHDGGSRVEAQNEEDEAVGEAFSTHAAAAGNDYDDYGIDGHGYERRHAS